MCVRRQATLRGTTLNLTGYPVNLGSKSVILRAAWVVVVGERGIEIRLV